MKVVYIAGPYGAETPDQTRAQSIQAAALGRLAQAIGYAPVVVHPGIAAVQGPDSDPETRALGLAANLEVVKTLARAGSELWVLKRPDGTTSEGTAAEAHAFFASGGSVARWNTWTRWRQWAATHGLSLPDLHDAAESDQDGLWGIGRFAPERVSSG